MDRPVYCSRTVLDMPDAGNLPAAAGALRCLLSPAFDPPSRSIGVDNGKNPKKTNQIKNSVRKSQPVIGR